MAMLDNNLVANKALSRPKRDNGFLSNLVRIGVCAAQNRAGAETILRRKREKREREKSGREAEFNNISFHAFHSHVMDYI